MKYVYVISMVAENKIRVLQRIAGVFSRNRLNILNMNIYGVTDHDTSYFNVTFQGEDKTTMRVILQLKRIIELLEVKINSQIAVKN